MYRRKFIKTTGAAAAGIGLFSSFPPLGGCTGTGKNREITISSVSSNFEREPLIRPFGFKGGYMTEIWQSASMLESTSGIKKAGICTQSVLWSDASVFANHSESGGNSLMYAITEHATQLLKGMKYTSPVELQESILEEVFEYGKKITGNNNLRKTFILNSLVGVDNAAWLLFAAENGITTFDDMIPPEYRAGLSFRHREVASIPLMAYTIPIDEIKSAVGQGYFFMKIKIGQPGTQEEMLEKDKERLSAIHNAIGNATTPSRSCKGYRSF
jgi:hypothetical protein